MSHEIIERKPEASLKNHPKIIHNKIQLFIFDCVLRACFQDDQYLLNIHNKLVIFFITLNGS